MKPYKLHPQAKADLLSAAEYYERKSWALAGRFAAEMDRLVQEICVHPGVHRIFRAEARRHFGPRFSYAAIYVEEPEHVLILAFAHFKRRPGYWVDRPAARLRPLLLPFAAEKRHVDRVTAAPSLDANPRLRAGARRAIRQGQHSRLFEDQITIVSA